MLEDLRGCAARHPHNLLSVDNDGREHGCCVEVSGLRECAAFNSQCSELLYGHLLNLRGLLEMEVELATEKDSLARPPLQRSPASAPPQSPYSRNAHTLPFSVHLRLRLHVACKTLLHRDDGFVSSRIERLYVAILHFELRNLIEVQDGFVCVADLEKLIDDQCDLPSREKRTQLHIIASLGRLAHEDTSRMKFIHQVLKFLKSSQASASNFQLSFSEMLCLSPLVLAPPQEH